jgi:hypothetical protein
MPLHALATINHNNSCAMIETSNTNFPSFNEAFLNEHVSKIGKLLPYWHVLVFLLRP